MSGTYLDRLPEELIEIICSHLDIESKAAIALLNHIPSLKDRYIKEYHAKCEQRVIFSNELTRVLQSEKLRPDFKLWRGPKFGERYRPTMATLIKLLKLGSVRGPLLAEQFSGLYLIAYINNEPLPEAEDQLMDKITYDDEDAHPRVVEGNYWSKRLGRLIIYVFESYDTDDAASIGFINDLAEAMKIRIHLKIEDTFSSELIQYIQEDIYKISSEDIEHIRVSRVMQSENNELFTRLTPSYSTVYWCKTAGQEWIVWVHSTIPLTDLKREHFALSSKTFRMRTILHKSEERWSIVEKDEELGSTIFQLLLNDTVRKDPNDPVHHVLACGLEDTALFE